MKILVTGCAGFIGAAVSKALINQNQPVIGIDNLNDYYDVSLKKARLAQLSSSPIFKFYKGHIEDYTTLENIFAKEQPTKVINLAAQAGVRYSLENPAAYIQSNLVGFANILEACRHHNVKHLIYASSSSVYGNSTCLPFKPSLATDQPINLYAATKKSNELMAYAYHHLYGLVTTGIRYFTVYGPWGRPDMAPLIFARNIINKKPIHIFNSGSHQRDFTYIDDVVLATLHLVGRDELIKDNNTLSYKVYNVGYGQPIDLLHFVEIIEQTIGVKAITKYHKKQNGDVDATWSDISDLKQDFHFQPKTPLTQGIVRLVDWVRSYYAC